MKAAPKCDLWFGLWAGRAHWWEQPEGVVRRKAQPLAAAWQGVGSAGRALAQECQGT